MMLKNLNFFFLIISKHKQQYQNMVKKKNSSNFFLDFFLRIDSKDYKNFNFKLKAIEIYPPYHTDLIYLDYFNEILKNYNFFEKLSRSIKKKRSFIF